MAIWCHGDIQAMIEAEGLIWVCDLIVARVYVDVYGSCCHEGHGSGPPPRAILVSEGCTVARVIVVWVACTTT